MRRALAGALALICVILLGLAQVAAQHIPPGKEKDVLELFAPYSVDAPADRVGVDVVLDSVAIEREAIRVTLLRGDQAATIIFGKKGAGQPPLLESTLSFDIWFEEKVADVGLAEAAGELAAAFKQNDTAPFWSEMPPSKDAGVPGGMNIPEPPGFQWYDFLGEFLVLALLVLFALTAANLAPRFRAMPRYLWVGLAVSLALGAGYRHSLSQAMVQTQDAAISQECETDPQCDDFNPCTEDLCINRRCTSQWAPQGDLPCCRADEECAPTEEHCVESYCDSETSMCSFRPAPVCALGRYEGSQDPPLTTSAGWLYAVPAKFTGNTPELAHGINLILSTLSILAMGLFMLAWGAGPGAALASSFLLAVAPISIIASRAPSISGFTLFFGLLFLIAAAPLVQGEAPAKGRPRILQASLASLLLFICASARPEALLAVVPGLILMLDQRRYATLGRAPLLIVGFAWLLTLASRLIILTDVDFAAGYPQLAGSAAFGSFVDSMEFLFVQGLAIPFIFLAVALVGIPVTMRRNRPLAWLSISLFIGVPVLAGLFTMTPDQFARYALFPALSLVIFAGLGIEWIKSRKVRYAELITAILVLYFAFFPLSRGEAIQPIALAADIVAPFFQL